MENTYFNTMFESAKSHIEANGNKVIKVSTTGLYKIFNESFEDNTEYSEIELIQYVYGEGE